MVPGGGLVCYMSRGTGSESVYRAVLREYCLFFASKICILFVFTVHFL